MIAKSVRNGAVGYGVLDDLYRQASVYAGRILNGAKPADPPTLATIDPGCVKTLRGITAPEF